MFPIKSWILIGVVLTTFFALAPIETAHAQSSFQIDLSFESATVAPQTGEVRVEGTVTCSEPALIQVGVGVRQAVGRKDGVQGFNYSDAVECDEDGEPFNVSVFAYEGRFGPGQAVIELNASGCTANGCDFSALQVPTRLTRR